MNAQEFEIDTKNLTPYFRKYKYRVRIAFVGVQKIRQRYRGKSIFLYDLNFDDETSEFIAITESFIKFKSKLKEMNFDSKIKHKYDSVDIYFNDYEITNLLSSIMGKHYDTALKLKITDKQYERDVIYHTTPLHKFRIFLKEQRYDYESKNKLFQFIKTHHNCHPSNSLYKWLRTKDTRTTWCWGYYSLDLDEEEMITIISLKFPTLIKKVCRIESK